MQEEGPGGHKDTCMWAPQAVVLAVSEVWFLRRTRQGSSMHALSAWIQ